MSGASAVTAAQSATILPTLKVMTGTPKMEVYDWSTEDERRFHALGVAAAAGGVRPSSVAFLRYKTRRIRRVPIF